MLSVFALALVLVACGGGDDADTDTDTGADDATEQTDDGAVTEPDEGTDEGSEGDAGGETASVDVEAAEASYQQSCSSCHGGNLEGGGGPALDAIGATLSEDEILDAIENGRPGMPPGMLQGDEAQNVAAWLAEKQ